MGGLHRDGSLMIVSMKTIFVSYTYEKLDFSTMIMNVTVTEVNFVIILLNAKSTFSPLVPP